MAYVVASHRTFTFYFISRQDVEDVLRRRCDILAWSKGIQKRYESSMRKEGKIPSPEAERRVREKLEKLREDRKGLEVKKSQIEAKIGNLALPEGLRKQEYAVFIELAEAVKAAYLITAGRMLNELRKHGGNFSFTAIEPANYV